jgi:hypothetical protein
MEEENSVAERWMSRTMIGSLWSVGTTKVVMELKREVMRNDDAISVVEMKKSDGGKDAHEVVANVSAAMKKQRRDLEKKWNGQ